MSKQIDLTGKRFGKLTVASRAEKVKYNQYWNCLCDCGITKAIIGIALTSGGTVSCGCHRKEIHTIHGNTSKHKLTGAWRSWNQMIRRCTDKKHESYKRYGERGITVCEEWLSFENFLHDMGDRPNGKTLDRIDNNKGYSKENCRWATMAKQQNNKTSNHFIEFNGMRKTIAEWAKYLNIGYPALSSRINILHWTTEKALTTPTRKLSTSHK